MQQARKWLFRPKFFSLSKWAQFLHVTLDLTGKRPVIFSAVLFFVFEKFSSTSTGGKCALRWFYCLEKQKLSLERTPPGKKLRFCIRYLWKMKEKPANLNRGLCFSIKWKATCRNWAHLDEEKNFGLKSHLRACCTQPFNCFCFSVAKYEHGYPLRYLVSCDHTVRHTGMCSINKWPTTVWVCCVTRSER